MARIVGTARHAARLRRIAGPAMAQAVGTALREGASLVEAEAKRLADESTAGDSALAAGIGTVEAGPLTVHVVSTAPHGRFLEFGTARMAERPFMRPAAQKMRGEVAARVRRAARAITS